MCDNTIKGQLPLFLFLGFEAPEEKSQNLENERLASSLSFCQIFEGRNHKT